MKLIVGLGNPGESYKLTRHNIGFMAADRLADKQAISLSKNKFKAAIGTGNSCGHKVIIAKPLTFMNLSGESAKAIASYYNIATDDILVVHDDMDIEFGQLRIKKQGGSAGHRGIGSLIKHFNNDNFLRVRVGIGKPPSYINPSDFVLQKFSDTEQNQLKGVIEDICNCIEYVLFQGPEAAMNRFHSSDRPAL